MSAVWPHCGGATDIVVANNADSGNGTLRQAIQFNESLGGGNGLGGAIANIGTLAMTNCYPVASFASGGTGGVATGGGFDGSGGQASGGGIHPRSAKYKRARQKANSYQFRFAGRTPPG
jgi:hypothetical protein